MPLKLPASRAEIRRIQKERKRAAVEQALRSTFWKPRLQKIKLDRLDDPDEWRKIPILDKDTLRALTDPQFYSEFCVKPEDGIQEYWRSGGVTGQPLFYPRSFRDRSEEHTSELQSHSDLVCRLLLEKKKKAHA